MVMVSSSAGPAEGRFRFDRRPDRSIALRELPRSRRWRTLLVDDSPLFLAAIADALAILPQIEVVAKAETGLEAIMLCNEVQPDLVLVDLCMPELDGLETIRRIRLDPDRSSESLVILLMSLQDAPEYRTAASAAGATAFLSKQEFVTELNELLRHLLPDYAEEIV